ncbi:hypothetical protein [Streptomyces rubrogriseus]|uniref:DUF308 domain-containing protein n=1 Tax=Streptomyces rubrogriseus TaxID=194673 RepID=A0A6G3TFY1_9ACTN|nr:hypothetical protein [Streptomyces rubrogriseus]NEC35610.1 hypothetical protein [Streptomyces rubrogriseus]
MAEHDSDREDREERDLEREHREGRERAADGGPEAQGAPFDEDAAWASIVAGYGEEPPDPPGAKPFKSVEDLALLEPEVNDEKPSADRPSSDRPLGSSVAFAPGIGPRDHTPAEPSDDDFDADDEGHFVPPEPPPLPETDPTSKFAWLGVLGGPVLLLLAVVLGWDMTWWLTTLSIGGFLGGFATLVVRMRTGDEDDDDPGRGAVV